MQLEYDASVLSLELKKKREEENRRKREGVMFCMSYPKK